MLIAFTSLSCIQSQSLAGTFINLGFPAQDIGVGSEGDVCVAGLDNDVYCLDFMELDWVRIVTRDLVKITRLDVNDDGTIYIISVCGVFYLDCENRWVKLAGGATDIGVGVDFTVWKVGTDEYKLAPGQTDELINYGIWRLFCDCDCLCLCKRICMRFRSRYIDPCTSIVAPKCYWFRTDGYGINIDVMPNGDAVFTVNTDDAAHTSVKTINHHGMYIRDYLCGINRFDKFAGDITVGNSGVVYVTRIRTTPALNGTVYKCDKNTSWEQVTLNGIATYSSPIVADCNTVLFAERISAGPYNQLWFIHNVAVNQSTATDPNKCKKLISNRVFTSSYFKYLKGIPKLTIKKSMSSLAPAPDAPEKP